MPGTPDNGHSPATRHCGPNGAWAAARVMRGLAPYFCNGQVGKTIAFRVANGAPGLGRLATISKGGRSRSFDKLRTSGFFPFPRVFPVRGELVEPPDLGPSTNPGRTDDPNGYLRGLAWYFLSVIGVTNNVCGELVEPPRLVIEQGPIRRRGRRSGRWRSNRNWNT